MFKKKNCSFLPIAKIDFYKNSSFLAMAIIIMAPLKMIKSEKRRVLMMAMAT